MRESRRAFWTAAMLAACFGAAPFAAAGQAPNERTVLDEINERLRKGQGFKDPRTGVFQLTDERNAALCSICGKPLYLHTEGFECGAKPKVNLRAVACPLCGSKFNAPERCNLNGGAGLDRDFCQHHLGRFSVDCVVWMCCNCGYAALTDEFEQPLPDEEKAFLKGKLCQRTLDEMFKVVGVRQAPGKPLPDYLKDFNSYIEAKDVPDWLKYRNAIEVYEHRRAPHLLMAALYREASYSARRSLCAPIGVLALSNAIRRVNQVVVDPVEGERRPDAQRARALALEERLLKDSAARGGGADADLFCLYVILAGCCDRMGDSKEAREWLAKAEARIVSLRSVQSEGAQGEYVRAQIKCMGGELDLRRRLLEDEAAYIKRAVAHLRTALARGQTKSAERLPAFYLMGELCRRTEDFGAAVAWFQAARRLPREKTPSEGTTALLQWIEEALASSALAKVAPSAEETELIGKLAAGDSPATDPARADVPKVDRPANPDPGPKPALRPALKLADPPATCADLMNNAYAGLGAWRRDRAGALPASIAEMIEGGYLTATSVNLKEGRCACPECRAELRYRKGRFGDSNDFLVFHVGKESCGKTLFGDGTVK